MARSGDAKVQSRRRRSLAAVYGIDGVGTLTTFDPTSTADVRRSGHGRRRAEDEQQEQQQPGDGRRQHVVG